MKLINEDLCSNCIEDQQTVDSSGYIKDDKLYNKYLTYFDNIYLVNIEKRLFKEYIYDKSTEYVKDIILIEANEDINEDIIKKDDDTLKGDQYIKRKAKNTPEHNKRKKELKKFNDKLNKLVSINKKTIKWCEDNNIGNYRRDIEHIIDKNMHFLDEYITKNGKRMEDLRKIYKWIYNELYNNWEMKEPDEEDDIRDLDLILKQEWLDYAIFVDEEYKKYLKI